MKRTIDVGAIDRLLQSLQAEKRIRALLVGFCEKCNNKDPEMLAPAGQFDEAECRRTFPDLTRGVEIRVLAASQLPGRQGWEDERGYIATHVGPGAEFVDFEIFRPEDGEDSRIELALTRKGDVGFAYGEALDHAYPSLQYLDNGRILASSAVAYVIEMALRDVLYGLVGRPTFLKDPMKAFEFLTKYVPVAHSEEEKYVIFLAH